MLGVYGCALLGMALFSEDGPNALYYLLMSLLLASSWWAVSKSRVALFFYLQLCTFSVFAYGIQATVGVRFFLGASTSVDELNLRAASIYALHIIALSLGAVSVRRRAPQQGRDAEFSFPILFAASLFLFSVCVVVVGLESFQMNRSELYQLGLTAQPIPKFVEFFAKTLVYILAALCAFRLGQRGSSVLRSATFLLVLAFAIIVSNPTNTPRLISLTGLMLVFVFYLAGANKTDRLPFFVALSPLVYGAIQPVTSLMRRGLDNVNTSTALELYRSLEFSSFQVFLSAVEQFRDAELFSNYTFSAIFVLVPRSIWESKASGIGTEVAEGAGFIFINASLPSFFNSFADFGYVGLVAFSFLSGRILGWLDPMNGQKVDFRDRRFGYSVLVFCLLPIFARGDFSTAAIAAYPMFLSYEVVRFLMRLRLSSNT